MRVSEAEELICPFIQNHSYGQFHGNFKCITTKCMAWKFKKTKQTWKDTSKENQFCYPENAVDEFDYDKNGILSWSVYTDEGYCQRLLNN